MPSGPRVDVYGSMNRGTGSGGGGARYEISVKKDSVKSDRGF